MFNVFNNNFMTILERIVIGLIGAGIGYLLVRYSNWFYYNFGPMGFAEKYFRIFGGSRLFFKLIGILVIFFSFLIIAGLSGRFLLFVASFFR